MEVRLVQVRSYLEVEVPYFTLGKVGGGGGCNRREREREMTRAQTHRNDSLES